MRRAVIAALRRREPVTLGAADRPYCAILSAWPPWLDAQRGLPPPLCPPRREANLIQGARMCEGCKTDGKPRVAAAAADAVIEC